MIETAVSKKEQPIAKYAGKFVCSSVDPVAEAQAWVEKHATKIAATKSVIVLGAGSGYHLVALAKKFPSQNIVVFERDIEFINFCKEHHGLDLLNVEWVHVGQISAIKSNAKLRMVLSSQYLVLKFGPVIQLASAFYSELQIFLNGRTPEGLQFIVSNRSQLSGIFIQNLFQPISASESRMLSIKDLHHHLKDSDESYGGQLIRALRELVV